MAPTRLQVIPKFTPSERDRTIANHRFKYDYERLYRHYNEPNDPEEYKKRQEHPYAFHAGCIILSNNQFLTVTERPRTRHGAIIRTQGVPGKCGFPKGAAEYNREENAWDTAARELWEETGININVATWVSPTVFIIPEKNINKVYIFFMCFFAVQPVVHIDSRELVTATWVDTYVRPRNFGMISSIAFEEAKSFVPHIMNAFKARSVGLRPQRRCAAC